MTQTRNPLLYLVGLMASLTVGLVAGPRARLEEVAGGLALPVAIRNSADGSHRLFIAELEGTIRVLDSTGTLLPGVFLDIRDRVVADGEGGLLGLAFHPDYATTGRFFVYYTTEQEGQFRSVISEFQVSPGDPNLALREERIILEFDQPDVIHNGGDLHFGPHDGFLYISSGDGGPQNPEDHAQDPSLLLGKILRIDIDSDTDPYQVPSDNPFIGMKGYRPEIWATGMRNPFRMSFDSLSGRLFTGDVGAAFYEEVDIIEPGRNYAWPVREGFHCFPGNVRECPGDWTDPIFEYTRNDGRSVTGGIVYRGNQSTPLYGSYIFGDFVVGRIWALKEVRRGRWARRELIDTEALVTCFGEDERGELYFADFVAGRILRVIFEWEEILPQAVDGDGPEGRLTSLVGLSNPEKEDAPSILEFFHSDGQPASVVVNGQSGSSFEVMVPAQSALTVAFSRGGTDLFQGWVRVRSDRQLDSSLLYSLARPNATVLQAGVTTEGRALEFTAVAGQNLELGLETALAVVNPNGFEITVELKVLDDAGATRLVRPILVGAMSQTAFFIRDAGPLPDVLLGTARVTSGHEFAITSLLTVNGFQSASLPLPAGPGPQRVP